MADPNRLLDDPALSPLARSVLRSADDDGPDPETRRRIAAAMGLGTIGVAAATAASAASGIWWKVLIVVGLIGAGTTTYVATRPSSEPAAIPTARPAIVPELRAAIAPGPREAPAPIALEAEASRPLDSGASHPRSGRTDAIPGRTEAIKTAAEPTTPAVPETATTTDTDTGTAPTSSTVGAAAVIDPRSLAAEVALLDRARVQLQHHDTSGALATLDEHARSFPGGALVAEADMLRIETTLAAGDRDRAVELARAFLQHVPDSPLAPRARAIVDGARRSP